MGEGEAAHGGGESQVLNEVDDLGSVQVVSGEGQMQTSELHCVHKGAYVLNIQLFLVCDGEGQFLNLSHGFVLLLEELSEKGQVATSYIQDQFFKEF